MANPLRSHFRHVRTLAVMGVQPLAQFAVLVLVAHATDLATAGVFFALTALTPFLAEFVGIGSSEASIRQVRRGEHDAAECLYSILVYWAVTLPLAVAVYAVLVQAPTTFEISLAIVVTYVTCDILGSRMAATAEHLSLAVDRLLVADASRVIAPLLRLAGLAGGIHLLGCDQPDTLALAIGIGSLAGGILAMMPVLAVVGLPRRSHLVPARTCLGFLSVQAARSGQQNLDRFVASLFLPAPAIALYTVGSRIAVAATLPVQAVMRNTYAQFFTKGALGRSECLAYGLRVMRVSVPAGIVCGLTLLALADVVTLLLGDEYRDSVSVIRWLAGLPALYGLVYATGNVLSGTDRQSTRSWIAFVALGAQLGTIAVLPTSMGVSVLVAAIYVGLTVQATLGAAFALRT